VSLALRALLITLAIQVYVSLAASALSVLAPAVSRDLGVPATLLGVFVGILYAGSMVAGLASGALMERHGAIRVSQAAALLCAVGIAAATGPLALVAIAPVILGLGYGPITPASSQILVRTTPPERLALTFSLKQTGVPLGVAMAGAALPALSLAIGWRTTFWLVAALGVLVAVWAQAIRGLLDVDLHPDRRLSFGGLVAPLRLFFADPDRRELGRTGFTYALAQGCVVGFLVTFLATEVGLSLVAAGLALTVLNLLAVAGRILWGATADCWMPPRRVLGVLGVLSGLCGFAMAALDASWPRVALLALCAVYGAVAVGWNGVQIAEIARSAPSGKTGAIAGASSFVTFSGVLVGPPLFGFLAQASGTFRPGFAAIGLLCLANGLTLLWRHRH
jgi:MFS family permease